MTSASIEPSPRIEHFDRAHLAAVVECVTSIWIADNVIARALGVTAEDYGPIARRICERALAEDLGLMLRDPSTDRIMGFYTAIDLVDALAEEQSKAAGENPRMRRWGAMLSRCLQWYVDTYHRERPPVRGETLYFNIGGTLPELRSRGFISRMTSVAHADFSCSRGYARVLAVATHRHSVALTRQFWPETIMHELRFIDQDDPDLSRITDPPGAMVSVTPLGEALKTKVFAERART
jgi:hypothetical protein